MWLRPRTASGRAEWVHGWNSEAGGRVGRRGGAQSPHKLRRESDTVALGWLEARAGFIRLPLQSEGSAEGEGRRQLIAGDSPAGQLSERETEEEEEKENRRARQITARYLRI